MQDKDPTVDFRSGSSYCRICRTKQKREQKRRQRVERGLFLLAYLVEHPCVDCGETDPLLLEFDHVRGQKTCNISTMVQDDRSLVVIKAEIEKCDVRCVNCHRRRTAQQQNWKILEWIAQEAYRPYLSGSTPS